ncbi:hypothetical protein FNV43_RR08526 [Rhamnella rubrinervis]|uniref:PCI domain-containing protein n=1 Tax=Rhamnella rubrinervis TaxID=2594499 RepID=A0A8K0H8S5_9ROSA|nr:hypothetical protein FNV43_RR08526 [Rhamnella rubrinervis]
MSTFAKPENALKRAEELINVGQKQDALQALHDLITSKRYRAWQKPLERIMFKYVELCVDLRRADLQRMAQALEEALDVDDLEADKRPEDLMLSFVSGEKGKDRDQRDRPDLSAPESLQLYLDTRFEQLKIATELGLCRYSWIDVHGQENPKASLMVVYYTKLSEIFWISASHLYHAYAWLKLFSLQKSFNKNLSQKDLQLIASSVVLAVLSVAPYDHTRNASHLELENEKELNLRMANLIGFTLDTKLERGEVLSGVSSIRIGLEGVLSCATQEVKDLYHLLEHEFQPLDLASKIQPLLTKVSKSGGKLSSASSVPEVQLSQYIPALEKLATLRLLQQVSRVYQTMKIECLSEMVPFYDFSVVEKISVDAVKYNFVAMKVDHMKGVVLFGNLNIESDGLRDHLAMFAESLNHARTMIHPPAKKASKLGEVLPSLADIVDREHKRLLARKSIIEKGRKNKNANFWKCSNKGICFALLKEREEESRRLKLQKITEEAEQKRLATEFEQRKHQRIRKEIKSESLKKHRLCFRKHLQEEGKKANS